jgi:hypothetical protein
MPEPILNMNIRRDTYVFELSHMHNGDPPSQAQIDSWHEPPFH